MKGVVKIALICFRYYHEIKVRYPIAPAARKIIHNSMPAMERERKAGSTVSDSAESSCSSDSGDVPKKSWIWDVEFRRTCS